MHLAAGQHTSANHETDTFTFLQQSGFRSRENKGGFNGLRGPLPMGFGYREI